MVDHLAVWMHYFCPYLPSVTASSPLLDDCFNILVDEPLNATILVHELTANQSIKAYVVDSLKRYHALNDVMIELSKSIGSKLEDLPSETREGVQRLLEIVHMITPRMLLVSTVESMTYESQRYLGNFIKMNDLPIPLSYYTYSSNNNAIEYKINFNTLAEVLCLTHDRVMLQVGSPSACGLGKSTMLPYIFHDKRKESITTTGPSVLRSACIDVLFGTTQFESTARSYVIFDLHGTVEYEVNHILIHAIQQYSSLQILYVDENDLEKNPNFLPYMINKVKSVPTIVIIFDTQYDEGRALSTYNNEIIEVFKKHYEHEDWSHVHWFNAPTNVSTSHDFDNKEFYAVRQAQRLNESFKNAFNTLEPQISARQEVFHSVLFLQTFFVSLKQGKYELIPHNTRFVVELKLEQLLQDLTDTNENRLIVTPVSYLLSKINSCRKKLVEDWEVSKVEVETEKLQLEEKLKSVSHISPHTHFFLELLLKRSYIELLIVEAFLDRWRAQFEPKLQQQMTTAKQETMQFMSDIKRLEATLVDEQKKDGNNDVGNLRNKISATKAKYETSRRNVNELETNLQNIDLTVGLFIDEIICLCEKDKICLIDFFSETVLDDLGKRLHALMHRGIALHILRGRPLCCSSRLLTICLQYSTKTKTPPYVLTVVGEQSSAKSSLLNTTFGCNFRVSAGRCTLGMYMSIVRWKSQTIVILDTEGLLSVEETSSIFDNQMITMAVLSSHLVLINHKGEFSTILSDLIGMSFYAKLQIHSPIKPKLLFVLRDQNETSNDAKRIFLKQLAELKKKLQDDSQFLKSSIDDELDIGAENVVLLSNAISKDVDPKLNITQRWRNKTFPLEINVLRHIIFDSIPVTDEQSFFQDLTDMYMKMANNWSAIDRLGSNLLACKTLYELAITNEVRDIANEITPTANDRFYDEVQQLINQTIENIVNQYTEIQASNDFTNENKHFQSLLDRLHEKHIKQAHAEFDGRTERSCYLAEVKQKVKKIIEPMLYFTKQQAQKQFSTSLHSVIQRVLIESVEKKLISDAQAELDEKKFVGITEYRNEVKTIFEKLIGKSRIEIDKLYDAPDIITRTVLNIYCSLLDRRSANKNPTEIHNLLQRMDIQEYKKNIDSFQERQRQLQPFLQQPKGSLFTRVGGKLGLCTVERDKMWSQVKQSVRWLQKDKDVAKCQKILSGLFHTVIPKLENDIRKLVRELKLSYSNPQTVDSVVSYIENTRNMYEIQYYQSSLDWTALVSDLAVIALHRLIEDTIDMVNSEKETKIKATVTGLDTLRDQIIRQVELRKNSHEQGRNLANNIGQHIFTGVKKLLLSTIIKDIEADIAKSEYIVHDKLQVEAYERSFEQGNAENIVKYVEDINRYFLELSLEKIKTKFVIAINKHIHAIEDLFAQTLYKANDAVQSDACKDLLSINNIIKKSIHETKEIERFITDKNKNPLTLPHSLQLPIHDPSNFRNGFKDILLFLQNIPGNSSIIKSELRTQVFESCKQTIKQRIGCEARCPGCGAKCSVAGKHEPERVKRLSEHCKCPKGNCICKVDDSDTIAVHSTDHHIASCFHGWRYVSTNEPALDLCYQDWKTRSVQVSDSETIFPKRLYYNQKKPAWFNNLEELSTKAIDCDDSHPPRSQRRAWMVVRRYFTTKYGLVDNNESYYTKWNFPTVEDNEQLIINFTPKWLDEVIDWSKETY